MALSKNIATYTDVHRVLEAALENNGVLYTLPTAGTARHFLTRCKNYRNLLHQRMEERLRHKNFTKTKFDSLEITLLESDPCVVRIAPLTLNRITSLETGEIITPAAGPNLDDVYIESDVLEEAPDELTQAANLLAQSLTGKSS